MPPPLETINRQRIDYIDVAKGILILIVILYHSGFDTDNDFISLFRIKTAFFYSGWFISSFFIITGYCSNFDKQFKPFFFNNLKTLIWPAVIGTSFICTLRAIVTFDTNPLITFIHNIPIGGFNWFLTALFFSKLIYWFVIHITNNIWVQCFIILTFSLIGVYSNDINLFGGNWIHYRHFLYMTIFLFLGQVTRTKKPNIQIPLYVGIAAAFVILLMLKTIGDRFALAGKVMQFNTPLIPYHLLFSIAGIVFIIFLAQLFENSKFLQYVGRNSLAFYIIHILSLDIIKGIYFKCITVNSTTAVVFYFVIVALLSIILTTLFVKLSQTKYLSWIIKCPECRRRQQSISKENSI